MSEESKNLVHPNAEGFVERVTPKTPSETVYFFKCSCGKGHFRHAGYMKSMLPFMLTCTSSTLTRFSPPAR